MRITEVISNCVDRWQSLGVMLAPPIAEDEVRRVWASFNCAPSADVLLLYGTVGGFQEYVFDEDLNFSFWPWDWLKKRNTESPRRDVMFCDHSIGIVTWELRYESPEHSSVWSSHGSQSAPSLQSFLEVYLQDPLGNL